MFITSPHDQEHQLNEAIQLEYRIRGAADYMHLQMKVNNFELDNYCNSSQCNVSITPLPSATGVILRLNINERTLKPDNYTFQACALIVPSDHIERCYSNPTCSDRTLVTIQGSKSGIIWEDVQY